MQSIEPPFQPGELAVVVLSDDPGVRVGDEVLVLAYGGVLAHMYGFDYEIRVPGNANIFVCQHRALKRKRPPAPAKVDWIKLCDLEPKPTETV